MKTMRAQSNFFNNVIESYFAAAIHESYFIDNRKLLAPIYAINILCDNCNTEYSDGFRYMGLEIGIGYENKIIIFDRTKTAPKDSEYSYYEKELK